MHINPDINPVLSKRGGKVSICFGVSVSSIPSEENLKNQLQNLDNEYHVTDFEDPRLPFSTAMLFASYLRMTSPSSACKS